MSYSRYFPYPSIREEQLKIIKEVIKALDNKRDLFIEAASGVGKTIAVLSACMGYVERGHKLLYLTRTHFEVDKVINEVKRINSLGYSFKAMIFRGRNSLCINSIVKDLPIPLFDEMCSLLRLFNACRYYNQKFFNPFNKTGNELLNLGLCKETCPYETILAYLKRAEILVTTYNYLLIPELREKILKEFLSSSDKAPIIVLDEVHNIQDLVHDSIARITLKDVLQSIDTLYFYYPNVFIKRKLDKFKEELLQLSSIIKRDDFYTKVPVSLTLDDVKVLENLTKSVIMLKISHDKASIGYLIKFKNFLKLLVRVLQENYHIILGKEKGKHILEIFNTNPLIFRKIFKRRLSIIAMSATLTPTELYQEMLDIRNFSLVSVPSPYINNGLFIIYPSICTSYKSRSEALYDKIINLIVNIDRVVPENKSILVFVPSHDFLKDLVNSGIIHNVERRVLLESEISKLEETENSLVLGVLGGRLSEGLDIKASVCLIIGIPYAKPTYKTMLILREYSKIFPQRSRQIAYIIPALRKALQAAGRILRGPDDRGVIIFADRRFMKLIRLFPRWLIPHLKIVKKIEQLLSFITSFVF